MGVKTVYLLNADRVEKSFWLSPRVTGKNIREQLVLGLEQAKDTILPKVIFKKLFKPFVLDELPDIIKGTLAIVAHPQGDESAHRDKDINSAVTLAIGPEGGFIDYEIEKLKSIGFKAVPFGDRILRVETALPVILTKIWDRHQWH